MVEKYITSMHWVQREAYRLGKYRTRDLIMIPMDVELAEDFLFGNKLIVKDREGDLDTDEFPLRGSKDATLKARTGMPVCK